MNALIRSAVFGAAIVGLLPNSTCGQAQAAPMVPAPSATMPAQYQSVLDFLGRKGDFKDDVLKVNIPRSDLKITVDGVGTPTAFGFGGWIAMTPGRGGKNVMMGDLVLLQEEVNPVMSALLDNGLEVTALHNHFFWEEPRLFYMHIHGMGEPAALARMVKPALDLIGHTAAPAQPGGAAGSSGAEGGVTAPVVQGTMNTAALSQTIGYPGELNGAVYKVTIPRSDLKVTEMGAMINSRMGLNTWAAFFGSDDNAVVAGDVAMLAGEVTPVLKALRSHGLDVVAIHQHMTESRPMIIFLHYWGRGPASQLAAGVRAAVDELGRGGNRHN